MLRRPPGARRGGALVTVLAAVAAAGLLGASPAAAASGFAQVIGTTLVYDTGAGNTSEVFVNVTTIGEVDQAIVVSDTIPIVAGFGCQPPAFGNQAVVCDVPNAPTSGVALTRVEIDLGNLDDRAEVSDNTPVPVTISGRAGADTIIGGLFGDLLDGGDGTDTITGDSGADTITGGLNNDTLSGSDGDDSIDGGLGDDTINGDAGQDDLLGAEGRDFLRGGANGDSLHGGVEDDRLFGDAGNDSLVGYYGNDELTGGTGTDAFFGGLHADTLFSDDGVPEQPDCGEGLAGGPRDTVHADALDDPIDCEIEL